MKLEPSVLTRLVKSEDLNHHRTLFAGRAASWLVEASFLAAARLVGEPARVVCLQVHGMLFTRPARAGDILEIRSRVAHLGSKSITVHTECRRDGDADALVSTFATFVVLGEHERAVPHGLVLSEAYIAANQPICAAAAALRATRPAVAGT